MRVLILSDTFPPEVTGGAARVAFTQAQALQRLGHEVHVLSTRRNAQPPQIMDLAGVHVSRLTINYPMRWQAYLSLYNPIAARGIEKIIRQIRPDIVHAHNVHAYLTYHSLAIARRHSVPALLTVHDAMAVAYQKFDTYIDPSRQDIPTSSDYRISSWSQLRLQRFRYFPLRNVCIRNAIRRNVSVMISPSAELLKLLKVNRVHATRMLCVPNGVNPSEFQSSEREQADFRAKHSLIGKSYILLAGRINEAKGGAQLLKALPEIVRRVPDAILLVLAPLGSFGEGMLAIAESLGMGQYIRFAGWLSGRALAAAFGAADVCVTPSIYFDNFPTVNLEAMAAGTPVVATCFGGSRELVSDGDTGFIVNPFNISMLADRISRVLLDHDLRVRMGLRAQQQIADHYDWLTQAERLVEIYQQALGPL